MQEVLTEAQPGHIILLHDAGGDRTATIQALPRIIDNFRAKGYEFVPLNELMGKSRAELMPLPTPGENRWAHIEGRALDAKGSFKLMIGTLFLLAIYLTLARSVVYGVLATIQKFVARRRTFDPVLPAAGVGDHRRLQRGEGDRRGLSIRSSTTVTRISKWWWWTTARKMRHWPCWNVNSSRTRGSASTLSRTAASRRR